MVQFDLWYNTKKATNVAYFIDLILPNADKLPALAI